MRLPEGRILLVPVGPTPSDLVSWLVGKLSKTLSLSVESAEALPLPERAFNQQRSQYQGDILLDELRSHSFPQADRVVGLVNADCYAPGLNFIFGQATAHGRDAIVALPRLRQSFYELPEDPGLFRQRALKEVVHELGHTWGLAHCPDPHCVMHFSNTLHDTDIKSAQFCSKCQEGL
jgi:archaemetzincin